MTISHVFPIKRFYEIQEFMQNNKHLKILNSTINISYIDELNYYSTVYQMPQD